MRRSYPERRPVDWPHPLTGCSRHHAHAQHRPSTRTTYPHAPGTITISSERRPRSPFSALQGRRRTPPPHGTPYHTAHTPHVTHASYPSPGTHPARTRHAPGTHPARTRHTRGTRPAPGTRAYKTRPDHGVRARNEIGSGVRTLAVVRAVLTTIATLTTPLRHVILLGFVV